MADEAFALSPINARAAMPSDADYDAIREAFMETSRGRWFLSEYAKRNRNADTRMVLDAVARIEQTVAAQKQAHGASGLSESLVAIHAIVGEARAEVARSIAGLGNDAVLTAARDGVRIISEVSRTLRECGADVRICNLLDNQVAAIEAGQRLVAEIDRKAVLTAFDTLLDRVHDLAGEERPHRARPSQASDEPASPAADGDLPEAAPLAAEPAATAAAPVISAAAPQARVVDAAAPDPALTIVTGTATDELEFVEPGAAVADETSADLDTPSTAAIDGEISETHDVDTMLDLVAMEMSAAQPDEPGELEAAIEAARIELEQAEAAYAAQPSDAAQADVDEAAPAQADVAQADLAQLIADVATPHEPAVEMARAAAGQSPETDEAPSPEDVPDGIDQFELGERGEPLYKPQPATTTIAPATSTLAGGASASLGAALLANGVVSQPGQSRSEALAPLRRMSQPEKIAFFS